MSEQDDVAAVQRCEKAYNRLRDELAERGFEVRDTPAGALLVRRSG